MTDDRKNVVSISTNKKIEDLNTDTKQLTDEIKELEATNKVLKQILIHTIPIIKVILPHLKNRPEIKEESLQAVEKMLQIYDFLNIE